MKKKLLIVFLIILILSVIGYLNKDTIEKKISTFNFNFKIFLLEDEEKTTVKIDGIDISKKQIQEEELKKIESNISTVYNNLGNREHFFNTIGHPEEYYDVASEYLTKELYNQFIDNQNEFIRKSINNIYSEKNNGYYQTNLIDVNVNKTDEYIATIEVVSIKDNRLLMSEKHKLTFDKDLKISKFEVVQDFKNISKTTSPLLIKNVDTMNALFIEDLRSIFSDLSNKYLYENYVSISNKEVGDGEKSKDELLKEVELQKEILFEDFEFNKKVLDEIFMINEGVISDYVITEYTLEKDKTIYAVNFVYKNEIFTYNVEFDRIINEVIGIKRVD